MRRDTRWNTFYNTTTLACYRFDLQQVTLDSIDEPVLAALASGAPAARYKVLSLAAHEYTHWRDQVATLWGRRLLSRFYQGVTARFSGDASRFRSIVDAQREIGRCTSRRYFLYPGPKHRANPPWAWTLSFGLAFDGNGNLNPSDPIPFVKFWVPPVNVEENLIVRMPISAASLAEVRAMYAEYCWIVSEEKRYPNGGTPANSGKWLLEYASQVYDEEYLEYTTALHLLANQTGATTIWEILPHASALAGIALNFPASLVSSLQLPNAWQDPSSAQNGLRDRFHIMLETRSPGFLFSLLCSYAKAPVEAELEAWIDSVLQAAGNFSLAELRGAWEKEICSVPMWDGRTADSQTDMTMWLDAGLEWALSSSPIAPPDLLLSTLDSKSALTLPGALTLDWDIWFPTNSGPFGGKEETLERIDRLEKIVRAMDEFCEVCGR